MSDEAKDDAEVEAPEAQAEETAPAERVEAAKADAKPAAPERPRRTPEEDAAEAVSYLEGLFQRMDMDVDVTVEIDNRVLRVSVGGQDANALIAGQGAAAQSSALEALQTIVTRTLFGGDRGRTVVIDADGYRARRIEALEPVADAVAEFALSQDIGVRIFGMNGFDRRGVHVRLQDRKKVATESDGYGTMRTLTVGPRGKKPEKAPEPAPEAQAE